MSRFLLNSVVGVRLELIRETDNDLLPIQVEMLREPDVEIDRYMREEMMYDPICGVIVGISFSASPEYIPDPANQEVQLFQRELYPVYGVKEILEYPQLKSRGFWSHVDHPELGEVTFFPGSPCVFSGKRQDIHRVSLIGEHNEDIYCAELGISEEELVTLKGAGVI
jgi:hypothetical protein